ncbi:MAG: hypothetical protein V3T30_06275, partial [Thermodesulfobacteriota bacterium]
AAPGQETTTVSLRDVFLYYTITNTGNGFDTFELVLENLGGDDYDLSNISIYIDENGDGVIDPGDQTYDGLSPPGLAMDETKSLIVKGIVTTAATSGTVLVNLRAASNGDPTKTDINNVARINIVVDGYIASIKSADTGSVPPGGLITFTVLTQNQGSERVGGIDITNTDFDENGVAGTLRGVLIRDEIPANTTYVQSSFSTPIVPAEATPVFAGANGLWVTDSTVPAVVEDVGLFFPAPGASTPLSIDQEVLLSFDVLVDPAASNITVENTAYVDYSNNSGDMVEETNKVLVDVEFVADVIADDTDDFGASTGTGLATDPDDLMSSQIAISGHWETFTNEVWNMGNGAERVEVSYDPALSSLVAWDYGTDDWELTSTPIPAAIIISFYNTDGTILEDTDNDGTLDSGLLAPGERFEFLSKIFFPLGNRSQDVYMAIVGTSSMDPSESDLTFNHIFEVMPALMNIEVETSIGIPTPLGLVTERLTNVFLNVYEYDTAGTLTNTIPAYANSVGNVVAIDPSVISIPLYERLQDGDPIAGTGYSYRIALRDDYNNYTHYLTPHIYRYDFDQVSNPGDTFTRGEISVYVDPDGTIVLVTPLDPSGYVYDGNTGAKVDGACVVLYRCTDGAACNAYEEVAAPVFPSGSMDIYPDGLTGEENPQVTGPTNASGGDVGKGVGAFGFKFWNFDVLNSGWYFVETDFDCGLPGSDPSLALNYSPVRLDSSAIWIATAPATPYAGQKFYIDDTAATFQGITRMIIPLAVAGVEDLVVSKSIDESAVTVGDIMRFTVTVTNINDTEIVYGVTGSDIMPKEARYKTGSMKVDGVKVNPTI